MDFQSSRQELVRLIKHLSYREGDFTLSSGKKSHFYIDLKATTLHPDGAYLIGECVCFLIQERWSDEKRKSLGGIGGLTLGADPLATSISLASRSRKWNWPAYIVRKEPKKHGTSQYIEGVENLSPGADLLVLEDVVTTGASSIQAIQRLRSLDFHPVAVLTIVDREEGGRNPIEDLGLEFLSLTTLGEISAA